MATNNDIALWLLTKMKAEHVLYQQDAAVAIQEAFGGKYICTNEHGNFAINRAVLRIFRSLTAESVVWIRSEKLWRLREAYDEPSRTQDV